MPAAGPSRHPLIWCAISGHGYGHAAQVTPVLNELARRVPGLTAILRTAVPAAFFRPRLTLDWTVSAAEQDVGCVQRGPLHTDVAATWRAYEALHADWARVVAGESLAMREAGPGLVLSDVPHPAVAAAAEAGIPAVALSNLSWDLVLEPYQDPHEPGHRRILDRIRSAYARADLMLQLTPGLAMKAFRRVVPIGPIHHDARRDREALVGALGIRSETRIVLIGFGGVPLDRLDLKVADRLEGYHFVYGGPVPAGLRRVTSHEALDLPFPTILASVDAVITKPGYGTIVEAVAQEVPVLYVRRHTFADEECLLDYLRRYGRGLELAEQAFWGGSWAESLDELLRLPRPTERVPDADGAAQAAEELAAYF